MQQWTCLDGDMVDAIARAVYGDYDSGDTARIFDTNPGLVDYGVKLPAGLVVNVPQRPAKQGDGLIRLWD